jgi:protein-tyrosine phosphatase
VGDLVRTVNRWVTGALHPRRRDRVRDQLRAGGPPQTILIVCYGNICRSPYGAAALRRLLPPTASGIRIESAGFIGAHRTPPANAVDVAAARGIDLRRHVSRIVSAGVVTGSDLVIVMEPGQADMLRPLGRTRRPVLVLGDLDPLPSKDRRIQDPVEQPRLVFAECYDRIDRCLGELVRSIWGGRAG